MCLTSKTYRTRTEARKNFVPIMARKDLKVYKKFKIDESFDFTSPLRGFSYVENKTYELGSKLKIYFSKDDDKWIGVVYEGFHSYKDREYAENQVLIGFDELIVECTIPRGAMYLRSGDGQEIVSTVIKIGRVHWREKKKFLKDLNFRNSRQLPLWV